LQLLEISYTTGLWFFICRLRS